MFDAVILYASKKAGAKKSAQLMMDDLVSKVELVRFEITTLNNNVITCSPCIFTHTSVSKCTEIGKSDNKSFIISEHVSLKEGNGNVLHKARLQKIRRR